MKTLVLCLAICACLCEAKASEHGFKIGGVQTVQIISDTEALCIFKGELVLISGADFGGVGDKTWISIRLHGTWGDNFKYKNLFGTQKTVRRINAN